MQYHDQTLLREWQLSTLDSSGGKQIITDEYDVPFIVWEIDSCTLQVLQSSKVLFGGVHHHGEWISRTKALGERLRRCIDSNNRILVEQIYDRHVFSPYFELFKKVLGESVPEVYGFGPESSKRLNQFVDRLREIAASDGFKRMLDNQSRMTRENAKSLREYINGLFAQNSKVLVVRVDLGLSKSYRATPEGEAMTPDLIKQSFAQLMRRVDRQFPDLIGYAWKFEFGMVKSYHYHLLLFFNGQRVREDITIGQLVVSQWESVTEGKGTAWSCNSFKNTYRMQGRLGIGMVDHADVGMRRNLERAALYLVKIDFYVKLKLPNKWRTFGRGTLKKDAGASARRGRPRENGDRSALAGAKLESAT